MTEIRRGISYSDDDELVFNAHVGIFGEQELNYNGKIVWDIMKESNMIMINVKEYTHGVEDRSRA